MESRQLLSATFPNIQIGAVYFEDAIGEDAAGDLFEITFSGGAPGTQLTRLIIDTDKRGDGLTDGDPFFDIAAAPPGSSAADAWKLDPRTSGIDSIDSVTLLDGGTKIELTFTGFDPGDRLVFSVDADEAGYPDSNPVVEGKEFEGSKLTATFAADNYFEATGGDIFWDAYDAKLSAAGLPLPKDDYVPPGETPRPDQTAGAIFSVSQAPLPTIAGTVFEDVDLDNSQDPGEPGIGNVVLTLYELVDGQYVSTGRTTTTNASGDYRFVGVQPGTYRVFEQQPSSYFSVGAAAGTVGGVTRGAVTGIDEISGITLIRGDDSVDNDFAEARPADLSGHVYHDADNDGIMDPGEAGIGNVVVRVQHVLADGTVLAPMQTTTDATGFWSVDGLMPGDYLVTEVQPDPSIYLDGLDTAGNAGGTAHNPGDRIDGIHLHSGQSGLNYDFGELMLASISGRVIADADGDCVYTPGDILLAGVSVQLLDASGQVIATTLTDAKGEYSFTRLVPGVYGVAEIQPDDYFDGGDHVGSAGGSLLAPDSIVGITLASAAVGIRYDFCEIIPSSISGRVHVDLNGNSIYDPGEKLLSGVTVRLLDASGKLLRTTQTDSRGEYLFDDLPPGTYGVEEIQPTEYNDGPDHVGSVGGSLLPPDSIIDIELTTGTDAIRYDFCELPFSSLSGYVYVDDNNNGLFDAGEVGIAGVALTLLDAAGAATTTTTTTDATGYYRFDGLKAGAYGVAETQPAAYFDGLDTAGSVGGTAHNPGDQITNVVLKPGIHGENYNFGELRPASIAGRVHGEVDRDCIPDPGEPLLAGVVVHLLDADGNRIATTTTDEKGEYVFRNLRPGVYGVEEIQPTDYLDGPDHPGSAGGRVDGNDRIVEAQLGSGVDAVNYNFCEVIPARISGYVFQDGPAIEVPIGQDDPDPATVRDGKLTPDDKRLAGVVLKLGDGSGAPLQDSLGRDIQTVTDSNGYYEFTMLEPGSYSVVEVHPTEYTDSLDTVGTVVDAFGRIVGTVDPRPSVPGEISVLGEASTQLNRTGTAINANEPVNPLVIKSLTIDPKFDAIVQIWLNPGDVGTSYDFSEVVMERDEIPPPPLPPTPPPPAPPKIIPWDSPSTRYLTPPTAVVRLAMETYGSSGAFTWHLSVINAGQPRSNSAQQGLYDPSDPFFNPESWSGVDLTQAEWYTLDSQGVQAKKANFGSANATPLTGDFNGDGVDEVCVFVAGHWFIDLNGNGVWDEGDFWAKLGDEYDFPVVGDWDGDGKADIGIFGPAWLGDGRAVRTEPGLPDAANGQTVHRTADQLGRYKNIPPEPEEAAQKLRSMKRTAQGSVRSDLIDHVFYYGTAGELPVAGDWNGDGVDNIGVFRQGTWILDTDGNGRLTDEDTRVELGQAGDIPLVGDFNRDGIDDLGVYRQGKWLLDTDGNRRLDAHDKVFELGGPDDKPAVGDFNGDGVDEIVIYRSASVQAGTPSAAPVGAPAATSR